MTEGVNMNTNARIADVIEVLNSGGRAVVRGFGTFEVHIRPEFERYDPIKGEVVTLPPTRLVKFRPARKYKRELNDD